VPTLVVRNPAVSTRGIGAKARLTILLALDFHPTSDVVLRWAKEFRARGSLDLVACHVNWRVPGDQDSLMPGMAVNFRRTATPARARPAEEGARQNGDDGIETIVRPYFGDPGPCLVEIASERKAQLIAVGAHQRRGCNRLGQFSVIAAMSLHPGGDEIVICDPGHLPGLDGARGATFR
jgi:nucleotide-binding universal stress UspA family protein